MSDQVVRSDEKASDWQQLNLDRLEKVNLCDIQVIDVQDKLPEDAFHILYENSEETEALNEFVDLRDDVSHGDVNQNPDASRSTAATTPPGEVDDQIAVVEKKLDEAAQKLETMLGAIESTWEQLINRHEEQILKLICQVVETIIYTQIDLDREVLKGTVLNVFKSMPHPTKVRIHIHPDDYEQIDTAKDDFFENIQTLKQISVVSDATITRGGCKILSDVGEVDTGIEARLEAVKNSLMEAWAARTARDDNNQRSAS